MPNGNVLLTGSAGGATYSAEIYNPKTESWTPAEPVEIPRILQTATLLRNGCILVAGGYSSNSLPQGGPFEELFDPGLNNWKQTGALNALRQNHTATLLSNGRVLVVGGSLNGVYLSSVEIYDPETGTWTFTGALNVARANHSAVLLPSGKVLVAGGYRDSATVNRSAELFDPQTGIWTQTGTLLNSPRQAAAAMLLPNGLVLLCGGDDGDKSLASSELYDPVTDSWATSATMEISRQVATVTPLENGTVLVAGGASIAQLTSSEVFDSGATPGGRPQIDVVNPILRLGSNFTVTGSGLPAPGSGGDIPIMQLRNLGNEPITFISATNWSTNFVVAPLADDLPIGWALVAVSVNGAASESKMVNLVSSGYNALSGRMLGRDTVELTFIGIVGTEYVLERSLGLPALVWTPQATNRAGANGLLIFTNSVLPNTNSFWRVREYE